jgi:hypothetical protein
VNGEPRPSDSVPPPRTGVRHFKAPASPDHAGLSRTRASAHVLVRRSPNQTARREHPIHTFVIISPRYRGDRESWGILHGMIMVRPSPTPATGIRATSGHSARWPVESTGFFVFARRRGAWPVKAGRGHVVRFWSGRMERRSRRPMDYSRFCQRLHNVHGTGRSGLVHFFSFPSLRRLPRGPRTGSVQEEAGPRKGRLSGAQGGAESWTGSDRGRRLARRRE